ncbi:MAG: glycosyltransferase [wastewater metagenome]|nr:glycosyltransferase [Candidatus Loosdrechtia aerotolerans]
MPILNNDAGVDIPCISQEGDNLGERISNAFLQVFQENGRKRNVQDSDLFYRGKNIQHNEMVIRGVLNRPHCNTIIIGTDCPGVDARLIENAFELLKKKDVVIGPCEDGGYYLLGMSRFIPDLFIDIIWGTDQVLSQTIGRVQKNGLSYSMLKKLTDIDIIEDMYQHMPDFL